MTEQRHLTWVAALATLLTSFSLSPLFDKQSWVPAAVLMIALVAVVMAGWRFLVQPVVRAVAAVARGITAAVRAVAGVVADAAGWAWRAAGTLLAVLGRLAAFPFVWTYRHVLTPVGHAVRAAWRAAVRPVRSALRTVRGSVRRAVAVTAASARETGAQVRHQLSVLLGRPR